MTVQDVPNFVDYVGDGILLSFNFVFRVDDLAWVSVDFTDDIIGFTLNIDQDTSPGGTLDYSVAPPNLQDLRIVRATPVDQQLDYTRYDPFDSESHEGALDKLTMEIQDLTTSIQGISGTILPGTINDAMLRWDTGLVNWVEVPFIQATDTGDLTMLTGGTLRIFNPLDTQALEIAMTNNPATINVTGGAGINFTGAISEYFFSNTIRVVNGLTAQSNGVIISLNGLGTAGAQMFHDDIRGYVESLAIGDLNLRVDNGAATQEDRIILVSGAASGVILAHGANNVFRTTVSDGSFGVGRISAAEVRDVSDSFTQVGLATMKRINISGAVALADNIFHHTVAATGNATDTLDAADFVNVPDGAVAWFVGNGGSITLTEGIGMVFRKFLGGGASVTGTVTIADGGWATARKNIDGEWWWVGMDLS